MTRFARLHIRDHGGDALAWADTVQAVFDRTIDPDDLAVEVLADPAPTAGGQVAETRFDDAASDE